MAASLLDGIDFDNPDSWELTTVVKALCIATQERHNIAYIGMGGGFFTRPDIPNDPLERSKYFPYKSNTGLEFELNDGDPLQDFTGYITLLLSACSSRYADIEKWDDAETDKSTSLSRFDLGDTADDSGTYDNRLFEITGYTSYPDLSVYAPEEIKKWYDMLIEFKYVIRSHSYTIGDDYELYAGEFDGSQDSFYVAYQDGSEYYGVDASSGTGEPVSDTSHFDAFKSGHDGLFGTTSSSFDTRTDSASFPISNFNSIPYYAHVGRFLGTGDYRCECRSFNLTVGVDWTEARATVGFTGKPLSYKNQASCGILSSGPTGQEPNVPYPASTTGDNQRYYTTITHTDVSSEVDELAIDYDIGLGTMPTAITDIAAGESVAVRVTVDNSVYRTFLELWDGEGGFDYYTP